MISSADTSNSPVVFIASETNSAVSVINTADCPAVDTFSLCATSGMTAAKICFFQFKANRTAQTVPAQAMKIRSASVTDSMSPNRYAVRSARTRGR